MGIDGGEVPGETIQVEPLWDADAYRDAKELARSLHRDFPKRYGPEIPWNTASEGLIRKKKKK
jgi:hypothetical protein